MNRPLLSNQRGVGLIEILVTMLLLSTALLTLASLQTRSLQYNQGAYFRSQANILAYDILDRIRANKADIVRYNLTLSSFSGSVVTSPLYDADISQWRRDVNMRLPSAKAGLDCTATTMICTVTIQWGEINSTGNSADDITTFEYKARI